MSDILMIEEGDGGDFLFSGGDLVTDDTFFTAIYLSLFTGDAFYNTFSDCPTSTAFEEALNCTISDENLQNIEDEANAALAWMVTKGLAASISTEATNDNTKQINIAITVTEPSGVQTIYSFVWDSTSKKLLNTTSS